MKTIEERAEEYNKRYFSKNDNIFQSLAKIAYIRGATEQKAVDEANYEQGYHDAVENARKWFADYLMEIGYPDDWMRDSSNTESGEERFIKAMEE